jgi:hypothetical protein
VQQLILPSEVFFLAKLCRSEREQPRRDEIRGAADSDKQEEKENR